MEANWVARRPTLMLFSWTHLEYVPVSLNACGELLLICFWFGIPSGGLEWPHLIGILFAAVNGHRWSSVGVAGHAVYAVMFLSKKYSPSSPVVMCCFRRNLWDFDSASIMLIIMAGSKNCLSPSGTYLLGALIPGGYLLGAVVHSSIVILSPLFNPSVLPKPPQNLPPVTMINSGLH